jgi:hypothetical protein
MSCPRCGATSERARLVAPGLWRCENQLVVDENVYLCGTQYQEGGGNQTQGMCWCGVAGIGVCQGGCGRPLCGDHALRPTDASPVPIVWNVSVEEVRRGAPGKSRRAGAWKRALLAHPGIACSECRNRATEERIASLPRVSHPDDPVIRLASIWLELQQSVPSYRGDYAALEGLSPLWEEFPTATDHLVVLGRAGELEPIRISLRESKRGRPRETTRGWTLGGCSSETYSDWHGDLPNYRYDVVVNERGHVSYAKSDGSGGAGSYGTFGTWRRAWFESLKDVTDPALLYQSLAWRFLPHQWRYLGELQFFAFGAGDDPGDQGPVNIDLQRG